MVLSKYSIKGLQRWNTLVRRETCMEGLKWGKAQILSNIFYKTHLFQLIAHMNKNNTL